MVPVCPCVCVCLTQWADWDKMLQAKDFRGLERVARIGRSTEAQLVVVGDGPRRFSSSGKGAALDSPRRRDAALAASISSATAHPDPARAASATGSGHGGQVGSANVTAHVVPPVVVAPHDRSSGCQGDSGGELSGALPASSVATTTVIASSSAASSAPSSQPLQGTVLS